MCLTFFWVLNLGLQLVDEGCKGAHDGSTGTLWGSYEER
jgi:hypothetical protein